MLSLSASLEKYVIDHTSSESDTLKELNRQTHLKALAPNMLSGHLQGKLLEMISCMVRPKRVLELGTYTGYSAICLAKGMPKDGELHTVEINDELQDFASEYIEKVGLTSQIKQHIGSALEIIPTLTGSFDLVFIDADKREYPAYYQAVMERMEIGGILLVDNVLWYGKVVEETEKQDDYVQGIIELNQMIQEDHRVENLLLPFRDGLMMARKIST